MCLDLGDVRLVDNILVSLKILVVYQVGQYCLHSIQCASDRVIANPINTSSPILLS